MTLQERDYYRDRAASERRRAAEVGNSVAGDIHTKLACLYEKLVELEEVERPKLSMVS